MGRPGVKLLLDTHALLWWLADSPELPSRVRAKIADPAASVWVSASSAWEIATKVRIGKLELETAEAEALEKTVLEEGFHLLPIQFSHALRAGLLKSGHRDPFDRILAAQALVEDFTVVSRDPEMKKLGCRTVW